MNNLKPIGPKLVDHLALVYQNTNRKETERSLATELLAVYAADRPEFLAKLLMDGDEIEFVALYPKLAEKRAVILSLFDAELGKRLPNEAKDKENSAKRQANAAVALLRLEQSDKVWPLLQHSEDPTVRSYVIHRLGPLKVDVKAVLNRLKNEPDLTIRRALLLSLGEFDPKDIADNDRKIWIEKLLDWYCTEADAGLHGAVEWLLRQWGLEQSLKEKELDLAKEPQRENRARDVEQRSAGKGGPEPANTRDPLWYVDYLGQTMVVIPAGTKFRMGSPKTEVPRLPEEPTQQTMTVERTFAIAAKSVTKEQFLCFPKSRDYLPKDQDYLRRVLPAPNCPGNWMIWNPVQEYCNWLSQEARLPKSEWCYVPDKDGKLKPAPDYLNRKGYRLPTEAEWECACRAGAVTSRYYGESAALLGKYACYVFNSDYRTFPVASLKPNDWGLFDMHGNVWSWCHKDGAEPEKHAIIRGGSFADAPQEVRAACRFDLTPDRITSYVGLRPVRTFRVGD
jgi:formylglycine-generating enzyme required for sulfatase activity